MAAGPVPHTAALGTGRRASEKAGLGSEKYLVELQPLFKSLLKKIIKKK